MDQKVSRPPVTAEARARSKVITCGICGRRSGTGTGFSSTQCIGFPLSVSFHQRSLLIFMLLLPEGQTAVTWEPSNMRCSFGNPGTLARKVFSLFVFLNGLKCRQVFYQAQKSQVAQSV